MQRRKKSRRFKVKSSYQPRPIATITALILLIALGVAAWSLDDHSPQAPTEDVIEATAAPDEGTDAEAPVPTSLPTPSAVPAPPTEATEAPDSEPAAPANPMGALPLFSVAYAEGTDEAAAGGLGGALLKAQAEDEPVFYDQTPEPEADAIEIDNVPSDEAEDAPEEPAVSQPNHRIQMTVEDVDLGPLSGIKIGIDPGHQMHGNSGQEPVSPGSSQTKPKVSSGTEGVRTGREEYAVVLEIALKLRDALEEAGATVYMTREVNDVDISNIERAQMMNDYGVDVVLRLHLNGSENASARGIGLYVKSSGEGAAVSRAICDPLLQAMGEATGAPTESVHISDTYSGLNWSTVPSILVEMGYMSNPEEDELVCSDWYQDRLVTGMKNGLISYFGSGSQAGASLGE